MIILQLDSEQFDNLVQNSVRKVLNEKQILASPTKSDQWFNLPEFCKYHPDKPTEPTVYGWVRDGLVPVHKGSKRLRFLKSEIDLWLKSGKRKTLAELSVEADQYILNKKR